MPCVTFLPWPPSLLAEAMATLLDTGVQVLVLLMGAGPGQKGPEPVQLQAGGWGRYSAARGSANVGEDRAAAVHGAHCIRRRNLLAARDCVWANKHHALNHISTHKPSAWQSGSVAEALAHFRVAGWKSSLGQSADVPLPDGVKGSGSIRARLNVSLSDHRCSQVVWVRLTA